MTYSYNAERSPKFETVDSIIVEERIEQFVGEKDILQEILYIQNDNQWIKNPKVEIVNIYNIALEKRPIQQISSQNLAMHNDPFLLYAVGYTEQTRGSQPSRPEEKFITEYYYDGYNNIKYENENKLYEPFAKINGEIVSVNEREKIHYSCPDKIKELLCGNGCFISLTYQLANIKYNIEIDAQSQNVGLGHYLYPLKVAINNYNDAMTEFKNMLNNFDNENSAITIEQVQNKRNEIALAYKTYIIELVKAQEENSRRKGEIV